MFERRNNRKHFFFLIRGFLWWPNNDLAKEPVDYQILVHSFGATSSPSCASFCLKKTDLDNLDKFDEETINTVNRNLYEDDCLKSVPTTDKVARLSGQFRELLSRGGFRLTKWISSDRNVINSKGHSLGPLTVTKVIAAESVIIKAVQHDVLPMELAMVG